MQTDDIDLHILRGQHGWSDAILRVNRAHHEFRLTHIFDDPLEAIAQCAVDLSTSTPSVSFDWNDEPGCYRWTFERKPDAHNLFVVQVGLYPGMSPPKHQGAPDTITFCTEYRFWKTLVFAELARTKILLRSSPYRDDRSPDDFPNNAYHKLEAQLAKYLKD